MSVSAETWTDNTGKFQIEAEFSAVNGKNVVLKKPDGSTIEVPINRLSAASHARAKELYQASMADSASPATAVDPSASPNANLSFKAPVAPAVAPMPAFPENATLQATFDFCRAQLMAGHPEVLWHALPRDMRQMLDSRDFRSTLAKSMASQQQTTKQVQGVFEKLAEVLVTKKQFVLKTGKLTDNVPPPMMPLVQEGYDPVVGTVYEVGMLIFDLPSLRTQTMTKMMDAHGPKLGGHLKVVMKMLPEEMLEQAGIFGISVLHPEMITFEQPSADTGIMRISTPPSNLEIGGDVFSQGEGTVSVTMERYMGRWIPKDMADEWQATKDSMLSTMKTALAATQQNDQAGQNNMMVGLVVTMAGGILDPLLAAKTQTEFDQALQPIDQLAPMLDGLFGGGGPAGGGPGGGFPGGPGGGFPGGPGGGFPGGPGGGFPGGPAPGGSDSNDVF
jgi:hypothetical protein